MPFLNRTSANPLLHRYRIPSRARKHLIPSQNRNLKSLAPLALAPLDTSLELDYLAYSKTPPLSTRIRLDSRTKITNPNLTLITLLRAITLTTPSLTLPKHSSLILTKSLPKLYAERVIRRLSPSNSILLQTPKTLPLKSLNTPIVSSVPLLLPSRATTALKI